MTVFDPSTLHQLVDDVHDRPFVLELASTYRRMIDRRVERVVAAVAGCDPDETMDAVLSLKVSSTMTGASELAEMATCIEASLRTYDLPRARSSALMLPDAAARTGVAIDRYLARVGASA